MESIKEVRQPRVEDCAPAPGFANEPITDMVVLGAVRPHAARVWMRTPRPGPVRFEYWPAERPRQAGHVTADPSARPAADYTLCVRVPEIGRGLELEAGTAYAFRVVHEASGALVGEGGFETAPRDAESAPERFSIALMSCNQPFTDEGRPAAAGAEMLRAVEACFERHHTKLALTVGDQMYTDYPRRLSLFDADYFRDVAPDRRCARIEDCTAAQVRALLQQRYRHFWNFEGWRKIHARYPCYPIVDDHELVDNWGSALEHDTPAWRNFIVGARAAYYDYQASRVSDEPDTVEDFDHEIEYGPVAVYLLDLRSNRRTGEHPRICSEAQLDKLREFLTRQAHASVVMVVLSVPAIHLPRWGARAARALSWVESEDFSDRWSTAGHVRDRDRVLRLLHDHQKAHPAQQLSLLSGDIHIGCAHEIVWRNGTRPLVQFVSSGITHMVDPVTQLASKASILANRRIVLDDDGLSADVRLMASDGGRGRNPYTKLNIGLVEFERRLGGAFATRFLIYGHRNASPVCVFESSWRQ